MSSSAWDRITVLVIIVVLAVLIALQRINAEAGLALIGALAGLHGGVSLSNSASASAAARK